MKRVVSVILFISLMMTLACAFADGTKEITFQGIPWFSSPEEVTGLLGESGFIDRKPFGVRKANDRDSLFNSNIAKYSKDKKTPYKYVTLVKDEKITTKLLRQWISQVEKTIAKQTVSFMFAYYTAEPDNPQLVEIAISLKSPDGGSDPKSIYDALEKALGKPKSKRKNEYVWLGDNNTIAILNRNNVVFATLTGLEYAETIDLGFDEPEDTGF